ncbi:hypothetical protein [Pararhodobacter sp. CCB-MM2]|uniref:hypothetical protein n=1 Tax=Pararhodobacter sp. CCB-MM2 TaxID=1786003 RepID=UPI00082C5055|nr:hypothetical protein [Pararhodobacter sp. CCB-MM2]
MTGAAAVLTAKGRAMLAAGDHMPEAYDAEDPYLATVTAEREPVFRTTRTAPPADPLVVAGHLIAAAAKGDPLKAKAYGALSTSIAIKACAQ